MAKNDRRPQSSDQSLVPTPHPGAVATRPRPGFGKVQMNPEQIVEAAMAGDAVICPKVHTMHDQGEWIAGYLEGEGSGVEVRDPVEGWLAKKTWVFDLGGRLKLALVSSHQLDRELPKLVGRFVRCTILARVVTNAKLQVKDYLVESWATSEEMATAVEAT